MNANKKTEWKPWEVEMRSCALVHEVCNDMCHNWYFHAKVRVWTGRNTFYRRSFVVWFDSEELAEHFEGKRRITKADVRDYARETAWAFIGNLPRSGEVTAEALRPWTAECVESIEHYNGIARAA